MAPIHKLMNLLHFPINKLPWTKGIQNRTYV